MGKTTVTTSAANDILSKCGFTSEEEVFDLLVSVPENRLIASGLGESSLVKNRVRILLQRIEADAVVLSDVRAMTARGALLESMRGEYGYLKGSYQFKRKRLKELLVTLQGLR